MKKSQKAKTNHRTNLRRSAYFKHWKTLETTLTSESVYLLEKLALPTHPATSLLINVMLI